MNPTFSLADRIALVTGSSQGIGYALAQGLRASGAEVIFHGLPARTAEVPAECAYLTGDLLRDDGPRALIEAAFAERPGLDTLICNAGSFFDRPFLEMTPELWQKTMQLNVTAP